MIRIDPASLAIGYIAGTLLCWYIREMLESKCEEDEDSQGNQPM